MRSSFFCRLSVLWILAAGLVSLFGGDKGSLNQLLAEGRAQFFDNQYNEALAIFDKALSINPQSLEARLGKMDAMGALRQPIDNLAKSAGTKQTSPSEGLILGANEKIWKRQFDQALVDLNQALEENPKAYLAHFLAAFLHRRVRQFDQAVTHLNKAYELAPDFPETSYLMGEVFMAQGNTAEALKAYQRYLNMVPNKGKRYDSVTASIRRIGGR